LRIVGRVGQGSAREFSRFGEERPSRHHDESRNHGGSRPDPLSRRSPREHGGEAKAEKGKGKDVRIEERQRQCAQEQGAPAARQLEVAHRGGERDEHERDAEQKWKEAEHEHRVDEERHAKETEPFVSPEGRAQRAQREQRPAEVPAHEHDVGLDHAEQVGEGASEEIIENVLRAAEGENEVLVEAEGRIVQVVDDSDRRQVKRKIHHRRILDDPSRSGGRDGDRHVGQWHETNPRKGRETQRQTQRQTHGATLRCTWA
jgi:hypothetical protein